MSGLVTSGMRFITKAAFRDSQSGLRKGACKTFQPHHNPSHIMDYVACYNLAAGWCKSLQTLTKPHRQCEDPVTFFAIATFVEVAGFVLYAFVFPKLNTIKGYRISAKNQGARTVKDDLDAAGLEADRVSSNIPTTLSLYPTHRCRTKAVATPYSCQSMTSQLGGVRRTASLASRRRDWQCGSWEYASGTIWSARSSSTWCRWAYFRGFCMKTRAPTISEAGTSRIS